MNVILLHWWLVILMEFVLYDIYGAYSGFEKSNIEGRQFVIATIHHDPYVIIKHNGTKIRRVTGFVPEIVAWMAEKYKFTYEYVEPSDDAYGAVVNGSWNGMVGMVVRGEAHMVAADLSLTYPRSLVVGFTIPFTEEPQSILIPYPQLSSTISGIVKPFQPEVWLGVLLCLIFVAVSLWLIVQIHSYIWQQYFPGKTKWFSYFWFLFRVMTNPGEYHIPFTLATRLVMATWCLTAVVLVNSYTSCLVSYLMAPKYVPLMNTIQDLADSTEISLVVMKHTSVHSALLVLWLNYFVRINPHSGYDWQAATSGPLAKLGDSLRAHPEYLITSIDKIDDLIFYKNKAFPVGEIPSKFRIDQDFKATKQCRLSIAKEPLFPDRIGFAMIKRSPLTNIYNCELIWLRQLGLLNYWKNSFLPKPNRCSAPFSSSLQQNTSKTLNLNYLSSAFLLYGVGVITSVIVFIFERSSVFGVIRKLFIFIGYRIVFI